MESSPQESMDAKAEFRKRSGDASSRKYRRRSPVHRSSPASDGSPSRTRSSSPVLKGEPAKISEIRRKKDDGSELDRDSVKDRYGRSGETFKHSDRQPLRSSRRHHQHDDYDRQDKYADDNLRDSSKLCYRSSRESRGNTYADRPKRDDEHRVMGSPLERYSRDKSDDSAHRSRDKERDTSDRALSGRRFNSSHTEDVRSGDRDKLKEDRESRDYKSSRDYRNSRLCFHEEYRDHLNYSTSRRENSGHRVSESSRSDGKDFNAEKYIKEEKRKYDDRDRNKERNYRGSEESFGERKSPEKGTRGSPPKKTKVHSVEASSGHRNDGAKDERQFSRSKQALECVGKVTSEQAYVTDADIDAAKIAAMKAAELVNRNLIGTGYMSTDQKKKLLWGNKKTTPSEESAHHWDTTLIGDHERQEKFKKLMSLRLPWYVWPIVGCKGRHQNGAQGRYGRFRKTEDSVGPGEAIHRWASTTRWPHCWAGSLRNYEKVCCSTSVVGKKKYFHISYLFLMILHSCGEYVISCKSLTIRTKGFPCIVCFIFT